MNDELVHAKIAIAFMLGALIGALIVLGAQ